MQVWNATLGRYFELVSNPDGELYATDVHKSFDEGREFRTFFAFAGATSSVKVIKVVFPCDFVLHLQDFMLNDGELKFEAVVGGDEAGSYNVALPKVGVNRTAERPLPLYESQASLTTGGTHTNGTVVELVQLKTSSATAQDSTVGGSLHDLRALPAGTYYLRFTAVAATKGIFALRWEERA